MLAGQSTINGKFDGCSVLPSGGGGNFSVVCKARHVLTHKDVALKFQIESDAYRQLCFEREGKLLTMLRGEPMVVQLIESPDTFRFDLTATLPGTGQTVTLSQAVPFVAVEWMERGDLSQFSRAATSRSEFIERLILFREACKAVRRLHRKSIFHRDIKPENLLLANDGTVRVSDLGTARLVAPGHPSLIPAYQGPVGDLRYTAPEMLGGLHFEPAFFEKSDIYSLGAILFELLTGMLLSPLSMDFSKVFDFIAMMAATPEARRKRTFEAFLDKETGSRFPDLWKTNPDLPRCCKPTLQRLAAGLAHFDFRRRIHDWDDIFRLTEICIRTTANEEAYNRMLMRRRIQQQRRRHAGTC